LCDPGFDKVGVGSGLGSFKFLGENFVGKYHSRIFAQVPGFTEPASTILVAVSADEKELTVADLCSFLV